MMTLERKDQYSIQELFEALPIAIAELARRSGINEVTLARIRDGKQTRLSTKNRLLNTLSGIYGQQFTSRNVSGIQVQGQQTEEDAA